MGTVLIESWHFWKSWNMNLPGPYLKDYESFSWRQPYFPQWKWTEYQCSMKFQFFVSVCYTTHPQTACHSSNKDPGWFPPVLQLKYVFCSLSQLTWWLSHLENTMTLQQIPLRSTTHSRSSSLLSDQSQSLSQAQVRWTWGEFISPNVSGKMILFHEFGAWKYMKYQQIHPNTVSNTLIHN